MEKLRSIIGFLGVLAILFPCNAGLGFLVFAEGVELLPIGNLKKPGILLRKRPGKIPGKNSGKTS